MNCSYGYHDILGNIGKHEVVVVVVFIHGTDLIRVMPDVARRSLNGARYLKHMKVPTRDGASVRRYDVFRF